MRDLNLNKSDFFIGVGSSIGIKIGEHNEGKKRYYYLLEMVNDYREKKK